MMEFRSDPTVQKCSIMMLAAFAEKKELSREIGESRCFTAIFDTWSQHQREQNLVKDILVTLRSLTMIEGNRITACKSGAIVSTIQSMKDFRDQASIQSQSLALLSNLAFGSDEAKLVVVKSGGLDVVVTAMRTFKAIKDIKVQLKACIILRSISSGPKECEIAIANTGGLECLLRVLEVYRRDAQVLEQAFAALSNLARSPGGSLQKSEQFNPILACTAGILSNTCSQPKRYARVHDVLISLLAAISIENSQVQRDIGKNGCLKSLILVVSQHIQCSEPPNPAPTSYIVVRRAASLFRCLAFQHENRQIVSEDAQGIPVLVGCIRILLAESLQVENALLALANTIFDSQHGKEHMLSCKGISTIIETMREHVHESGIQEACLLAIRAVSEGSETNSAEIVDHGGPKLCVDVMARFQDNAVLQEQALAAIIVLLQSGAIFEEDQSPIVAGAAAKAVKTFPYSIALCAQRKLLLQLLSSKVSRQETRENEKAVSVGDENIRPIRKSTGRRSSLISFISSHGHHGGESNT
jgi:hypothetical protein